MEKISKNIKVLKIVIIPTPNHNSIQPYITYVGFDIKMTLHRHTHPPNHNHHHTNSIAAISQFWIKV